MKAVLGIGGSLVVLSSLILSAQSASAQGTLRITFDGPPVIAPGTGRLVGYYFESAAWFSNIPGTDGFVRLGSGGYGWPDNGTAYVQASMGDSLVFGLNDGSEFGLISVDLAEYSYLFPVPATVRFVGYRRDGSTVATDLVTDGIIDGTGPLADFETLYFGPEFSGLTQVRMPTHGWSLDNLVLSVPEPSSGALLLLGGGILAWRRGRGRAGFCLLTAMRGPNSAYERIKEK